MKKAQTSTSFFFHSSLSSSFLFVKVLPAAVALGIGVLGSADLAQAQEAKVIKVKGRQAIVEFPKGSPPTVGQKIPLGGGGEDFSDEDVGGSGSSRDNLLGVAAQLSSLTNSVSSTSKTTFQVTGRYGWNSGTFEYGPLAAFSMSSPSAGDKSQTFSVGGFLDFNLIENKRGVPVVYGLGTEATFGQTSGGSTSSSLLNAFFGGNVKWFGLGEAVALRLDAGYWYDRRTTGGSSVVESGFIVNAGLSFYF